jgi:hypothetical protein
VVPENGHPSWWARGSGEWTSNLLRMPALVENWSPSLIPSAIVSSERILGTFYGILVPL